MVDPRVRKKCLSMGWYGSEKAVRFMKPEKAEFTEEELDFIREMMNVGAGNAATALEQMLGLRVDLKIPKVKKYLMSDSDALNQDIGEPTRQVTAVFMNLVGQVKGKIVFIVPDRDLVKLISSLEKATPGGSTIRMDYDLSVIAEIGNILAGTYLSSIHDFCLLNIYHSTPRVKSDMLKTLTQELFPDAGSENLQIILVKNQFIMASERITTHILLVPDSDAMERFAQSLRQAKDKLSVP
jgi:chemotaxis protein CheC